MTLNLISGAWIPVRRSDGTRAVIRPAQIVEELSRDGSADDGSGKPAIFPDWPRPDLNMATLELLIGLISVALPPEDDDEWLELWNKPPSIAELDKAFAPYERAFNLDGDGPRFCQDFEDLEGDVQNIEALFVDDGGLKASDNTDLFVKRDRYPFMSRAASAIALYGLQQFAPSGGRGHRTSLRGGGPMTTLGIPSVPNGKPQSLWQLLWANVQEAEDDPLDPDGMASVFPWLVPTPTSEDGHELHQVDQATHPLQAFFGMPRRIRLQFDANNEQHPCALSGERDDIHVTGYVTRPYGINYGQWRHPLTPYYCKKEGDQEYFATHPHPGRFGYRNWASIALGTEGKTREPAKALRAFRARLRGSRQQLGRARLLVAGWAMSNMKPLDYVLAEQPLYVLSDSVTQNKLDEFARKMVLAAESVSKALIKAIQAALKAGKDAPKADSALLTNARETFFADTEADFHNMLAGAAAQAGADDQWQAPFAEDWLKQLQQTAFKGFDGAVQPDPSDIKRASIVVKAREKLRGDLFARRLRTGLGLGAALQTTKRKKEGAA